MFGGLFCNRSGIFSCLRFQSPFPEKQPAPTLHHTRHSAECQHQSVISNDTQPLTTNSWVVLPAPTLSSQYQGILSEDPQISKQQHDRRQLPEPP
ncbi:hypothetical protein SKAU_G00267160 [Synaphobranchus kaupii]|uniref:Uncharacterized protein n=1 Tax=Synaphobranchus kaupii TaxID=118154 RepID=A0A9Q1EZJ3_SYNKA|nr:hypothetical protein SKAU_G00267160 [Synaphobranchus kaupii]